MFLATAAFSIEVGGQVINSIYVIGGSSADNEDDLFAEGNVMDVRLAGSAETENGKFGGSFRLNAGTQAGTPALSGWAFWRPIDMLKIQWGINPDGEFGLDGITRWSFYGAATDVFDRGYYNGFSGNAWGASWHGNWYGTTYASAFYKGFGDQGVVTTFTPIDGFELNVGLPYFGKEKAADVYRRMHVQAKYTAGGIGTFGLSFAGGGDHRANAAGFTGVYDATASGQDVRTTSDLYLYINLAMIENLGIDLGFKFAFPGDRPDGESARPPIAFGLGLDFGAGAFGFKARAQFELGASEFHSEYEYTRILFDLLPSYAINDSITAFLSFGMGMGKQKDKDGSNNGLDLGWHLMPYISYYTNLWGSGSFWAGVRIESLLRNTEAPGDPVIRWGIPVGLMFCF